MSHSETVRKLHAWRTCSDRVLKRSAFITYELGFPWDPDINPASIEDDLPRHVARILFELLSTAVYLSQKSVSPPPWFSHDASVLIL